MPSPITQPASPRTACGANPIARRPRARWICAAVLASACSRPSEPQPEATPPVLPVVGAPQAPAAAPLPPAAPSSSGPLHFLALGGGPTPESNEVSLEQDIELVRRGLPPPGLVLFAGGSGSASVRELDPSPKGDPVKLALGDLFAPRAGRQSRYRAPRFAAERATLVNLEARLSEALAVGDTPLLLYVAGHGDQGPSPEQNAVAVWGGHSLSVVRLAELHEQHQRPLRVLATSCFSGGFAELAFAGANAAAGQPSSVLRCGLFAGTADRETSGCDPNPNRRAQESYALHVAHALAGSRKDGSPLPLALADYARDGALGLLDAHTFARIQAVSIDVPTTTSERWLRHVQPGSAAIDPALLPEEMAVVEQLGKSLGLADEAAVQQRWQQLDQQMAELDDAIAAAEEEVGAKAIGLATLLLERWPVLDDPFHPDFEAALAQNRGAIEAALATTPEARVRAEASLRAQESYDRWGQLGVEEARVLRVLRAYETLHQAAALMKRGGAEARQYQRLLACERAAP
jgi:hypothetical protein